MSGGTTFNKEGFPDKLILKPARGNHGLVTYIADQTTDPINVPFLAQRGTFTLDGDTVRGSRFFDANAGHGIQVGEVVELYTGALFMQAKVKAVVTNNIEIETPIDRVYSSGSTCLRGTDDLRVDGSITPVVFSVLPTAGQKGDFAGFIFTIESTSAMDFTKFGSLSALTNGCVLRKKRSNGDFKNYFNFKTIGQFIENSFEHSFKEKTGGGGFGFGGRCTWGGQSNRGVSIRVNGDLNEAIELVIQDDLSTGLLELKMTAIGHEVDDEI